MSPHTSASSLGGSAKGLRVGDFDPTHLLIGHLRAALADAERGERNVYSMGVRSNLLLESVHVDDHGGDLGVGEGVHLAARHHHYLLAPRVLDQKLHDASAHVPRRAQHNGRVQRLRLCRHVTPRGTTNISIWIIGYLSVLLSRAIVLRAGVGICRFVPLPTCFRVTDGPLRALRNATSARRASTWRPLNPPVGA